MFGPTVIVFVTISNNNFEHKIQTFIVPNFISLCVQSIEFWFSVEARSGRIGILKVEFLVLKETLSVEIFKNDSK